MKSFKKFTHRQIKSVIAHLKKYVHSREPEVLHQIRVDIKKIKAILEAIEGCCSGFKAHKSFIPFRKIFRMAGAIREQGVHAQLLQQNKVERINNDLTPGKVENLAAAFESEVPHFIKMIKNRAKKMETYSGQVHRDDFTRYFQRKKKEVKSQLCPKPRMSVVHKIRKTVKEVIYLSEVQGKLKEKEAKFYDNIQDTIGRLHDKMVLLDLLKNKNDEASCTQYEVIKSECLSDKKEIFRLVSDYYKVASS